ncbi:hypothetical protein ACQP2T_07335 [Nonomuraea sp. CA-143628]|uniref:hypothetical protein n=1 Tax=Nonomuraea sp. CA-143628 TaxID=3239997 RepID=UPI003D93FB67
MTIMWRVAAMAAFLGVLAACSGETPEGVRSPTPAVSPATAGPAAPTTSSTAGQPIEQSRRWKDIKVPKLKRASGMIKVKALGRRDAWAIGFEDGAEDSEGVGVLLRWGGSAWARVPLPWKDEDGLRALDVDGQDGVWISAGSKIARRSGGRWTTFEPFGIAENYFFYDIAVDKGRAVLLGDGPEGPYAVRWDGRKFSLNSVGDGGRMNAVSLKSGHMWIVGATDHLECQGVTAAIWHTDPVHTNWYMDDGLVPNVPGGVLKSVWQIDPDDVWAVGELSPSEQERDSQSGRCIDKPKSDVPPVPLVMHWDGAIWKRVKLPAWNVSLTSVTAAGKNNVWASGVGPGGEIAFLHYDGVKWTREDRRVPAASYVNTTTIPGTPDLWAVGTIDEGRDDAQAFILRRR